MANAAVLYANMADTATIGASSQELTMPASTILTPHVSERWRSLTNSSFFVLDLGALKTLDTVMVRGLTMSASGLARLRLSTVDSSGAAGDVLDTGALANQATPYFDLDYGAFVYPLPAAVSARYVRFGQSDPASTYVEAGAICVGLRTGFTYNFVPGASLGYVDRSRSTVTSGGQTLIWIDNKYRKLVLNFDWVTSAQRYGLIEAMDRVNGQHSNVLCITDTASTNLARDSIWGLVDNLTPVTIPQVIDIFGKQISISERL